MFYYQFDIFDRKILPDHDADKKNLDLKSRFVNVLNYR